MKQRITKGMAALGLTAAASLSAGFLIAPHEGKVNKVYLDPIGIPTVCYGQTGKDLYGKTITMGTTYTDNECEIMLSNSVRSFERAVERQVGNASFASDYQKAAMISFTYNVGEGNLQRSTLLRKFKAGDHAGACDEYLKWKYAGGKVFRGLEKRRAEERAWCLGAVPQEVTIIYEDFLKEDLTVRNY